MRDLASDPLSPHAKTMRKNIFSIACCLMVLAGAGVFAYDRIMNLIPCARPISYSIGAVDSRFGISPSQFADAVASAGTLWEDAAHRTLFQRVETGGMMVSAIYDYRQDAERKMKDLNIKVDQTKQSYDALKARYDTMNTAFLAKQKAFAALNTVFQIKKAAYEAAVAAAQNGHPTSEEIAALEKMRLAINAQVDGLNTAQKALNAQADDLNAVVITLNKLGGETNSTITQYNAVGGALQEEFNAALFIRQSGSARIQIFTFDDPAQLKRLLTHELGHAIGLDHVLASGAIMYRLNQSTNGSLAPADIIELQRVCRL